MAAPSQEYPAWLSVSSTVLTNAAGAPTATLTAVLNLPLTYYGPSIPLGTDGAWVYGGPTSPAASTSLAIASTATPSLSPSTSSFFTLPESSQATSSAPSKTSQVTTSSSSSVAPIAATDSSHTLVIALVAGIVGGFILLFAVIGLFVCLRRRPSRDIDDQLVIRQVEWHQRDDAPSHAGDISPAREPGEGSPRGSGEEHDPFLRASAGATDSAMEMDPSARLVVPGNQPVAPDNSGPFAFGLNWLGSWSKPKASPPVLPYIDEKRSSRPVSYTHLGGDMHDSGYASPSPAPHRSGHILPPEQLVHMFSSPPRSPRNQSEEEFDDADIPLLAGTPRVAEAQADDERRASIRSLRSGANSTGDMEGATGPYTRRTRFDDSYDLPPPHSDTMDSRPRSVRERWSQAVGLDQFPSWVRMKMQGRASPAESRSRSHSRPTSAYVDRDGRSPAFDKDFNIDVERLPSQRRELGMLDPRPISTTSGKSAASGNTLYHDALSRFGTPTPDNTASTNASNFRPSPLRRESLPPAYEATQTVRPPPPVHSAASAPDVLDLPVPRPASPFTIASSLTAQTRTATPPGLVMPEVAAWRNSAGTGSAASSYGITIDVLEEAPPPAGESWSVLRRAGPDPERRQTFGATLAPAVLTESRENVYAPSHHPSLHSSPHLSPHQRGAGSNGNSSLSGSGSSRRERSDSSRNTGSVSSQGHRLATAGAVSPTFSAFGHRAARASDNSNPTSGSEHSYALPRPASMLSSPPPAPSATVVSTSSSVTTHGSTRDARTGEILKFPYVPHTAGLPTHVEDQDKASEDWGGSWGGPDHLRALRRPTTSDDSGYAEQTF